MAKPPGHVSRGQAKALQESATLHRVLLCQSWSCQRREVAGAEAWRGLRGYNCRLVITNQDEKAPGARHVYENPHGAKGKKTSRIK